MPIKSQLDSLPTFSVHPGQFQILHSASAFRECLLNAIKNAQKRIYLTVLYLENDEAGQEILTAAYQAKQQNPQLDITICVDWHRAQRGLIGANKSSGNAAFYQEFADQYTYKIPVYGIPVRNREVFGVLHLKGFIIDDTVIYSGASLNNIYLNYFDRYRFDRYHVIANHELANSMVDFIDQKMVNNPAVYDLSKPGLPTTKELKSRIKAFRAELSKARYQGNNQVVNKNQIGITPLVGAGKRNNLLNQQVINLLASAKSELYLCTPYFNPPKDVIREIKRALKRGIKVHIVVGDKTANDFFIPPDQPFKIIGGLPYLYEMTLRRFARVNESYIASGDLSIHLWKHENNSYHLKGIWIDRQSMLLTGNNINPRAWALDLENGLMIEDNDRQLEGAFSAEFDNILIHAPRIESYRQLEAIRNYPIKIKRLLKRIIRIRADRLLKRIL